MFYLAERAEIEYEQGKWVVEPRWINTDCLNMVYYKDDAAYFMMDIIELPDNTVLTNRFRVQMDYEEFTKLTIY